MKRRVLMGLLGASVASRAFAQRIFHLATLTPTLPMDPKAPPARFLLATLAKHGYRLGENLTYESVGARGETGKLPELVAALKSRGVDVVVTTGYPTTMAAQQAGLPTVVAQGAGDPVATKMVTSLAHPGGNVTGISDIATTLSIKRLSLLKELLPGMKKVAMLWNRDDLGMSLRYKASADAAQGMGISVQALGVREPDDFEGVFEAMKREPPDAILMVSDALTMLNRKRVIDYAAAARLPAIYPTEVRSTGIGWALGVGRLGGILGPVIGGMLLGIGLPPHDVLLFAAGPALVTAALVVWLGFVSRNALARSSTLARSFD